MAPKRAKCVDDNKGGGRKNEEESKLYHYKEGEKGGRCRLSKRGKMHLEYTLLLETLDRIELKLS